MTSSVAFTAPNRRERASLAALRTAGFRFATDVGRLAPGDWERPTPCPGWDVTALVVHTASIIENLVPLATGNALSPPIAASELGTALHTADRLRIAVARGVDAWTAHSLRVAQTFPWGRGPGIRAVELTLVEVVGHGWDLATAFGTSFEIDDDVVGVASSIVTQHLGPTLRVGLFADPVGIPDDAPPVDRFAALLGRAIPDR